MDGVSIAPEYTPEYYETWTSFDIGWAEDCRSLSPCRPRSNVNFDTTGT